MRNFVAILIATWFGAGLIPPIITKSFASYYGTLFGLLSCYGVLKLASGFTFPENLIVYVLTTFLVYLLGKHSIPKASRLLEPWILLHHSHRPENKMKYDQYEIVVDEVFGTMVSCWPLAVFNVNSAFILILVFVLFRLFDGLKLPPACFFDAKSDYISVMIDDFVAAIYTSIFLLIFIKWGHS